MAGQTANRPLDRETAEAATGIIHCATNEMSMFLMLLMLVYNALVSDSLRLEDLENRVGRRMIF
jgi:hypothetical protein